MASKEKLRDQRDEAREELEALRLAYGTTYDALVVARADLIDMREELNDLHADTQQQVTECEADLNAETGRRELAEKHRKTAEIRATAAAEQSDKILRERDDLRRQLQGVRAATEQLTKAVYPPKTTFTYGGFTVSGSPEGLYGVKLAPNATHAYADIMALQKQSPYIAKW